ncbi:lantibiotic dehydratase [Streptomyces sp. NPDC002755]|uniref:lantibiotic dehydratase n=1 Tax=Streptomyces sp. NPDC002884 TaxID=3154544 RepID=UPI00331F5FDB
MTQYGTEPTVYACHDTVLLRVAALPASAPAAGRTRYALDADPGAHAAEVRSQVAESIADPRVRGAVAAASASLATAAEHAATGTEPDEARVRRTAGSLNRYLIRMATRPTPFGLLAGVALAEVGDDTVARLGNRHRKAVRPDASWLLPLLARWERRSDVWRRLRLVANDLCFVRGDRLVVPYVPDITGERPSTQDTTELTMRHTAAVAAALRRAEHPVTGAVLAAHLIEAFPEASGAAVDGLINQLVTHDVLLTDLRPADSEPDPLGHVIECLREVPGFTALPALTGVQEALHAYAAAPVMDDGDALATATHRMGALRTTERPLHVDLAVDARVRLPTEVAREAERAADLLWRLAPGGGEPSRLRQYHADFLERYGIGRLVPVTELLDPDIGLGAPAGYRHPRSGRAAVHEQPGDAERRRDQVLAALVSRSLSTGAREVVLDDDLIDRIQAEDARPALSSMELCGRVVATDLAALAAGDFTLWLSGTSGSRMAGAMGGRFAHLLGPAAHRLLSPPRSTDEEERALGRLADDTDADAPVAAQLSLQGAWLRASNISQVPNQLAHRIVVGGFADRSDPGVIGLRDLAVCAWPDRLALVGTEMGREITPATFHMLNMRAHAPNVARFLHEVTLSGHRSWEPWTWGGLDVLPHLPRVRHGRTILAAARWRTDEPFFEDTGLGDTKWRQALDDWRERWQVPEHVLLADGDRFLQLDLSSPAHARILRQERGRSAADLLEVPGGTAAPGWLTGDEGAHSHEVVFPLTARAPRTDPSSTALRRAVPVVRDTGVAPLPLDSGWLYAKLYSSEQRQDEILTRRLPHLLTACGPTLRRWFFIRYRDPEPHLRLRFFAGGPDDAGRLLPLLGRWASELRSARLCGRMVLDTYDPEVERYGGPSALALAEEVFQADSESALVQLTTRQEQPDGPGGLDPVLLVALNYLDILHHLDGPARGGPGPAWLLQSSASNRDRADFRPHRRAALDLADPDGQWERLSASPGGKAITDSWARRAEALQRYAARLTEQQVRPGGPRPAATVVSSVLHMHHNRLLGIDRESERRSHAIARGAVQAVLDKRRYTR